MPEYKLIYFQLYGRAEPIRMMLTHAMADWEDFHVGEKTIPWPELKMKMPYPHQLPVLELADGTQLTQSTAIARFVARKFGYYPEDALLAARCDEFIDNTYNEDKVFAKVLKPLFAPEEAKEQAVKECFEEALPEFMKRVEPFLKDEGFLFGDKPTMPDFFMASFYFSVMDNPRTKFGVEDGQWAKFREANPKLVAFAARFKAEMGDYIDKRFEANF